MPITQELDPVAASQLSAVSLYPQSIRVHIWYRLSSVRSCWRSIYASVSLYSTSVPGSLRSSYVGVESTQTRLLAINKTRTNKNTAGAGCARRDVDPRLQLSSWRRRGAAATARGGIAPQLLHVASCRLPGPLHHHALTSTLICLFFLSSRSAHDPTTHLIKRPA
jgi:hypothetical protein